MNILVGVATNALFVLGVQFAALITLAPSDFGLFSIQYLIAAFGNSLCMSLIAEAWIRREVSTQSRASWGQYSTVLVYLSGLMFVATLIVSLIIPALREIAVSGSAAVAASTIRTGSRYYSVRLGEKRNIIPGDVAGLLITILALGVLAVQAEIDLLQLNLAWAAGGIASVLASRPLALGRLRIVGQWFMEHKREVPPLLRDSIITDLGGIATPLLLAPVLGLNGFGIYRAVSNAAAPVRLAITPLRPIISAAKLSSHVSLSRVAILLVTATTTGAVVAVFLWAFAFIPMELGVLSSLADFSVAAGTFVVSSLLLHYYSIVARTHFSPTKLTTGRTVQLAASAVLPLLAGIYLDLNAAIWAYALATAISAAFWVVLAFIESSQRAIES
ncbi:hypothetical protein FB385_2552 [Paramicrobacterium agarici]|nr:hypothetical protein FB385_2552 [Microbacterium agarici]